MSNDKKYILNLGAGQVDYSRYDDAWLAVHVDAFFDPNGLAINKGEVERIYDQSVKVNKHPNSIQMRDVIDFPAQVLCKSDVFDFVEGFPFKFNYIYAERIFEHMEYVGGEIGRLLEGINRASFPDATLEIIVPNAILLSEMIIDYEKNAPNDTIVRQINSKLLINTECVNCKADCHASVWTPRLAKEYIESEGTWKIESMEPEMEFAGRDIYMKIVCKKETMKGKGK